MSIEKAITEGIVFKKQPASAPTGGGKVKTKARKTSYIKGTHGSGAAKMKARYRQARANRHKDKA